MHLVNCILEVVGRKGKKRYRPIPSSLSVTTRWPLSERQKYNSIKKLYATHEVEIKWRLVCALNQIRCNLLTSFAHGIDECVAFSPFAFTVPILLHIREVEIIWRMSIVVYCSGSVPAIRNKNSASNNKFRDRLPIHDRSTTQTGGLLYCSFQLINRISVMLYLTIFKRPQQSGEENSRK